MNCTFCDVAAEPLECGHTACDSCRQAIGEAAPCPVSQSCDGGGVMGLHYTAAAGFAPLASAPKELAKRYKRKTVYQADKECMETILNELVRVENSRATIFRASGAPYDDIKETIAAERLAVLEFLEYCIKSNDSAIDVLELHVGFQKAGHEHLLRQLAVQRCVCPTIVPLPGHTWVKAYADLFRPSRSFDEIEFLEVAVNGYVQLYGTKTTVKCDELVRVGRGRDKHGEYTKYERSNGMMGIVRTDHPTIEVPIHERYRSPHVPGFCWVSLATLTQCDTGVLNVSALYNVLTNEQSKEERYLVVLF